MRWWIPLVSVWIGMGVQGCRAGMPPQLKGSLNVLERSPVGVHYEALLDLIPDQEGYRWRFSCRPRLVFRNDCPCLEAAGTWPDSFAYRWLIRWRTLSDSFSVWADQVPLSRLILVQGNRRWMIRRPENLLLPLFPYICENMRRSKR